MPASLNELCVGNYFLEPQTVLFLLSFKKILLKKDPLGQNCFHTLFSLALIAFDLDISL